MTKVEFNFDPGRDVEEPLYLDSARPRTTNSRPAEGASDAPPASERPLHLDFPREPRPRRRGIPLILACAVTFLLGAGAGVLYLKPPAVLREALSTVLGSERTGDAKAASQAAPMPPEPAHDQAAVPVPPVEAAPAPESPLSSSDLGDLPPPPLPPLAESPAKPRAAVADKARPHHATPPKKRAADAKPARAHSKAKAPLDLDALEKSLQ